MRGIVSELNLPAIYNLLWLCLVDRRIVSELNLPAIYNFKIIEKHRQSIVSELNLPAIYNTSGATSLMKSIVSELNLPAIYNFIVEGGDDWEQQGNCSLLTTQIIDRNLSVTVLQGYLTQQGFHH